MQEAGVVQLCSPMPNTSDTFLGPNINQILNGYIQRACSYQTYLRTLRSLSTPKKRKRHAPRFLSLQQQAQNHSLVLDVRHQTPMPVSQYKLPQQNQLQLLCSIGERVSKASQLGGVYSSTSPWPLYLYFRAYL